MNKVKGISIILMVACVMLLQIGYASAQVMKSSTVESQPDKFGAVTWGLVDNNLQIGLCIVKDKEIRRGILSKDKSDVLAIVLRNQSQDNIGLIQTSAGFDYLFTVTDNNGKAIPLTKQGENVIKKRDMHFVARRTQLTLKPGTEAWEYINIGTMYDISAPGTYHIKVSQHGGISIKDPAGEINWPKLNLEAGPLDIVVAPQATTSES